MRSQANTQERSGHPRRGGAARPPKPAVLLDRAPLLHAIQVRLDADVHDLETLLAEFAECREAYVDEQQAAGQRDDRRRRALYRRLTRLRSSLVALRASITTWIEATHIINPNIRAEMVLRDWTQVLPGLHGGVWPLPEIPPLRVELALAAKRRSERREKPDSRSARETRQIGGGRGAQKTASRPQYIRLLPPPPGRLAPGRLEARQQARQHTAGLPARDGRRDHRGPGGVA